MPSPKSNRNVALQYLSGLIEEGLKNTEIVRILKADGLGYRNQTMFADINAARLENFGATEIPRLGFDSPIPDRMMRDRVIDTDYGYSAVVKYSYTDPATGQTFQTGTTIYFTDAPSQAEVLSMFALRQESGIDSGGNARDYGAPEQVYYYKNNQ